MKRIATILLIGIFTLSSALCRAESDAITHNFNEMASAGTLNFPNRPSSYAVGETDLVTYTGSGGGGFGLYGTPPSAVYCITLPNNGVMQMSPAIADLTRIQLLHTLNAIPDKSKVKVYISTDNSTWTDISATADYTKNNIDAPVPVKGNYYVKLTNTGNTTINFLSVVYVYESCRCLRVVIN